MSKTIDIKSLLIGFLLATSVMLFLGNSQPLIAQYDDRKYDETEKRMKEKAEKINNNNTTSNSSFGRYQLSTTDMSYGAHKQHIFETIIDTKTGRIVKRTKTNFLNYE
tara:strand:+ start:800 stop:1123 length:324 start_codon:yes stop_codon:yes gene_type:complete